MCGICGVAYVGCSDSAGPDLIRRMCAVMAYRGPDDDGYYIDRRVLLGMRRLSIIDLAGGRQPIGNEDGTVQVILNGEIYNYLELRSELVAKHHTFKTKSDTEVIAHSYEEFGQRFVDRLRGMFSLALWDARRQVLHLAIDRFGIKPLYYAVGPEGLVFGSELKCVVTSGMFSDEADMDGLAEYFTLGYIPAPGCALACARKLEPGHQLRWTPANEVSVTRYWDLPTPEAGGDPAPDLPQQLESMIRDAVQSHLVSDVPVGAFLSGGIDSSTLVAFMSELSQAPVKTFSIAFDDRQHDESRFARLVAERYGTNHHELRIEPESVDVLPRLAHHFDEPFADASALPTYHLARLASEHVKVAISGDGGDEIFLGYKVFQGLELARHVQKLPPGVRRAADLLVKRLPRTGDSSWNDWIGRFAKRGADSLLAPEDAYRSKLVPPALSEAWLVLTEDFREQLRACEPFRIVDDTLARRALTSDEHPLDRFAYAGIKLGLAGDMLVKVDRMSMANSLEVRVPLLDYRLAEFVAGLPIDQRFRRWRLKGLLKDVARSRLPAAVLKHPKHGFTVPLAGWFRGDLVAFLEDILLDDMTRDAGYFQTGATAALLHRHRRGLEDLSGVLWALLMFELWRRERVVGCAY